MDTSKLSTLLHDATEDLEPRAGFTDAVLHGGRKRRLRRRVAVATSATVAVAVVIGGSVVLLAPGQDTTVSIAADWLTEPTKGPLRDDQQTIQQVLAAWETGKPRSPNAIAGIFDDLRGAPHVYWVGTTEAGPTAVVVQQAYLHPHENLPEGAANTLQTLVGLVTMANGKLTLVTDQFQHEPSDPLPGYFQFGAGDHTVLVVDRGQPLFQTDAEYEASANVPPEQKRATWKPFRFTDGVWLEQLPADRAPMSANVVMGPDPIAEDVARFNFVLASAYLGAAAEGGATGPLTEAEAWGLAWPMTVLEIGQPSGPDVDPVTTFTTEVENKSGDGNAIGGQGSVWHIRAGLADGRVAIIGNNKWGTTPSRLYAVLVGGGGTQVIEGEVVNKHSPLPVKMRMPDGQGWVVANYGHQLSYRTTLDGDWVAAGKDAALLPDDAKQVRVDDKVVTLP